MFKEKKQMTKRVLNLALVAVLSATVVSMGVLTGCSDGSDKKDGKGESVVTETQIVTKEVNGVYVDENGSIVTEPDSTASTDAAKSSDDKKEQSSKAEDNKQSGNSGNGGSNGGNSGNSGKSGNSGSTNKSNKGGNSGNSGVPDYNSGSTKVDNTSRRTTPSNARSAGTKKEGTADNTAKNLTIGDKTYNVGDTVTCTYFLTVPKDMLNFQGTVSYDSSLLKQTDVYLIAPASYGSVVNPNLDGRILFNGSMINGYDFTEPGYEFLVVEYEVLKTGKATPSISFEVLTDTDNGTYVSGGALTNGAKVSAVYE